MNRKKRAKSTFNIILQRDTYAHIQTSSQVEREKKVEYVKANRYLGERRLSVIYEFRECGVRSMEESSLYGFLLMKNCLF